MKAGVLLTLPRKTTFQKILLIPRLSHLFPIHPFSTSLKLTYGFLMFSGGRERLHWEETGQHIMCIFMKPSPAKIKEVTYTRTRTK